MASSRSWPLPMQDHLRQLRSLLEKAQDDGRVCGCIERFPAHLFEPRRIVAAWAQDVARLLGYGERTAALATDIFDRYVASAPPPNTSSSEPVTQLIGFCSFVLASKMEEPEALLPAQVHGALGGLFSVTDACAAERTITMALRFSFDAPLEEDFVFALLPLLGRPALGAPPTAPASRARADDDAVGTHTLALLARKSCTLIRLVRPEPVWLAHGPAAMAAGAVLCVATAQWPPASLGAMTHRQDVFVSQCAALGITDGTAILMCAAICDAVVAKQSGRRPAPLLAGPQGGKVPLQAPPPAQQMQRPHIDLQSIVTGSPTAVDAVSCACKAAGGRESPNFVGDVTFDWGDAAVATAGDGGSSSSGGGGGGGNCPLCCGSAGAPQGLESTPAQGPAPPPHSAASFYGPEPVWNAAGMSTCGNARQQQSLQLHQPPPPLLPPQQQQQQRQYHQPCSSAGMPTTSAPHAVPGQRGAVPATDYVHPHSAAGFRVLPCPQSASAAAAACAAAASWAAPPLSLQLPKRATTAVAMAWGMAHTAKRVRVGEVVV